MIEDHQLGELQIIVTDEDPAERGGIVVRWLGKSNSPSPDKELGPVLQMAADLAAAGKKKLIFSFQHLDFFNSATISVILRAVRSLRGRPIVLVMRYTEEKRWQKTFFVAFAAAGLDDVDNVQLEVVQL